MPAQAAPGGDAAQRLREQLDARRKALPPILRVSLLVAAGAWAAQGALVLAALAIDWHVFRLLLWFVGITTVAGGQAAALFAYGADPPLSVAWVVAMSVLNMVATLFLVVPLAWRAAEGLRERRWAGNVLASAERFAARHRAFLSRWGLMGLAVVAAMPVQGAGVLGAGALGVFLRVPLPRLLTVLAITGVVVNVAWALLVRFIADALPSGGWWEWLPLAVVVAIAVASLVAGRADRRAERYASFETFGWISAAQRERLRSLGIREVEQFLRVDLARLARELGLPASDLARCRSVALLLRLNSVEPEDAVRLTGVGIRGVRDLAVAPPDLLRMALDEAEPGAVTPGEVARWRREAVAFVAERSQRVGQA